jgi:hypothetical protein
MKAADFLLNTYKYAFMEILQRNGGMISFDKTPTFDKKWDDYTVCFHDLKGKFTAVLRHKDASTNPHPREI